MNKYTEANKRLALALGWTEIIEVGGALLGTPPDGAPESRGQAIVPDWCGDWRECGPLQSSGISLQWKHNRVMAESRSGGLEALLSSHARRCDAARYVIVRVKTDELEYSK